MTPLPLTLERLNHATLPQAAGLLEGVYEHSPWVAQAAAAQRPFVSLAQLKLALAQIVEQAGHERQIALVRAHPALTGKARLGELTAESAGEQSQAGLAHCTAEELALLQRLNADYDARFGHPFILAVRGPRGTGLARRDIIAAFERRLHSPPQDELRECLRQIHRIAELRLSDLFADEPVPGHRVWDQLEQLAAFSDPGFAEKGQLTVTYLSAAHQAAAAHIAEDMRAAGFDDVTLDAVGNVVGHYHAACSGAKALLTGSHYDTVRNGGKYDGRLGIYVPLACVAKLARAGQRLPFAIELVAFAEEEGQRYPVAFLGSGALTGDFSPAWLDQQDALGITMREAMRAAGLPATPEAIAALRRDPARYLGFVEVHIEQGPVLSELHLPLAVVSAINGSRRFACETIGVANHAGTTPMRQRRDAASAVAELALWLEQRAARDGDSVGTIGTLCVPDGSINVVPGRCQFTLDLRAPHDAQRDVLAGDTLAELQAICMRRGLRFTTHETLRAAAAPSASAWRQRWADAVTALGLPPYHMPSGAGHDAMKLHERMPQAMLFVRGENGGISHNPLESTTSHDIQLAIEAFQQLLHGLAAELTPFQSAA